MYGVALIRTSYNVLDINPETVELGTIAGYAPWYETKPVTGSNTLIASNSTQLPAAIGGTAAVLISSVSMSPVIPSSW